jgi:hypothetical protein
MQKATLSAFQSLQSGGERGGKPGAAPANPMASAAEAWWSMLQQPPPESPPGKPEKKPK